jgi:arabinogalactan endo-1,4-beta-galactosidase
MKYLTLFFALTVLALMACSEKSTEPPDPTPVRPDFFIRGADLSMLPDINRHAIQFIDSGGNTTDMLSILKSSGCNTVRVRLWHRPSDEISSLAEVAGFFSLIKAKGLKTWLCMHYSDTWADPGNQTKPAAWANLSAEVLADSVYQYTYRVVSLLKPDYVQTGNEINDGFLWPEGKISTTGSFYGLLAEAVRAVRTASPSTRVLLHYAGMNGAQHFFNQLQNKGIDYDVAGLSYYSYHHGNDLAFLKSAVSALGKAFGKPVVIAETAYPFTLEWNDFTHNPIGLASQLHPDYLASPQGQLDFMTKVRQIISDDFYGAGFCYWGGEWVAYKGPEAIDGSPWENQALFDFQFRVLPVAAVFAE